MNVNLKSENWDPESDNNAWEEDFHNKKSMISIKIPSINTMMVFGLDGFSNLSSLEKKDLLILNLSSSLLMLEEEKYLLEKVRKDLMLFINSLIWNGLAHKLYLVLLWTLD